MIFSYLAFLGLGAKEQTEKNKKVEMSNEWNDYMAYIKKQRSEKSER